MTVIEINDPIHTVTVTHDAESHRYACHDDCTAELSCPGVTDECRAWWSCTVCYNTQKGMTGVESSEYEDRLSRDGEAHGVEHQKIDGMWMTPTGDCVTKVLENDALDMVPVTFDGVYEVDIVTEEGFVYVTRCSEADPS